LITRPGMGSRYGYGLERLCEALGTRLTSIGGRRGPMKALKLDTSLAKVRLPVPLPKPRYDFPLIVYLTAAQVQREVERLGAMDLSFPKGEGIEAERKELLRALRLIQLGANVNDSASDWWLTPLAWAADSGSAEAVELLLKHGADVNQDAIVGTTALHAVAMGGSSRPCRDPDAFQRTAEILIAHGADIHRRATGHRGQMPLDDAVANNNDSVAAVLRKHGAQVSSQSGNRA